MGFSINPFVYIETVEIQIQEESIELSTNEKLKLYGWRVTPHRISALNYYQSNLSWTVDCRKQIIHCLSLLLSC